MTDDQVYDMWATASWLRNRVTVEVGFYANYLAGLGDGATADQKAFVARVLPGQNAPIEADYILWAIIFNTTVQAQGKDITDEDLRGIVQTTLGTLGRVKAV